MQVAYSGERASVDEVLSQIEAVGLGSASVRPVGEQALSIRTRTMTPDEHTHLLALRAIFLRLWPQVLTR